MKTLLSIPLIFVCATAALAHSDMQQTIPDDGAVLAQFPSEIGLNFTDKLRLTKVMARHADGEEQKIDLGEAKAFDTQFTLPLEPMGAGAYEVEWRGLGVDGHAMQGTFRFEVE